jgi:hypothetical protein
MVLVPVLKLAAAFTPKMFSTKSVGYWYCSQMQLLHRNEVKKSVRDWFCSLLQLYRDLFYLKSNFLVKGQSHEICNLFF